MEKSELRNSELAEKASAWQEKYDRALDDFFKQEHPTREELVDILWEYGIMNRIAPVDEEQKTARQELRKPVWDGSRDDPNLYLRILYCASGVKQEIKKSYSVIGANNFAVGVLDGARRSYYSDQGKKLYPEVPEKERNPDNIIMDEIMERAKAEIKKHGGKVPEKVIPYDAKGIWQGINVTVDRYSGNGSVYLRAGSYKDHALLGEKGAINGVPPETLNPEDFSF